VHRHFPLGHLAARKHSAEVREPRLDLGIGEGGIDLSVELLGDCDGCGLPRSGPAQLRDEVRRYKAEKLRLFSGAWKLTLSDNLN